MSWPLLLLLGLLTYGSRAAALALLPPLPLPVAAVLDRVPPALFAGLAVQALVAPGGELADGPILAAALGSLLVAPLRSLPLCLAAGIVAFAVAGVVAR